MAKGRTTIERRGGADFSGAGTGAGFACGGRADLERIDADRLGDVLELGRAEIDDREIEPPLDLTIGVLGQTDRAGLGDAFQPRGDIDAVAHQVAVGLLDDVAEMDADAELDPALGRHAGVALDHAVLHFDRAAHRVDHAAKLDEAAVAGALDDAPMMRGDGGIDQIAAQRPQPRQRSLLVRAGEPAVADDIGDQDRSDLPRFRHGVASGLADAIMNDASALLQARAARTGSAHVRQPSATDTCNSLFQGLPQARCRAARRGCSLASLATEILARVLEVQRWPPPDAGRLHEKWPKRLNSLRRAQNRTP